MKRAWMIPSFLCGIALSVGLPMGRGEVHAAPLVACHAVTVETCEIARNLGRGINLGNMLDAPTEGYWGFKAEPRFIDLAAKNFATVRVPVRWSNHAARTADATIDEVFAKRVDSVIDALLAKGVYVIVNVHHYNQLHGEPPHPSEFVVESSDLEARFLNIWKQLAERYKSRSSKLLFELLNEPHGRLNGEPWNELASRALTIVRQSNPTRTVLVGPSYWNNARDLPKLKMPLADRNLILAIHNYEPLGFTHQGLRWIVMAQPVGTTCCDAAQKKLITDGLDAAKRWSDANGYPVHLGEFGVVLQAPESSREAHIRFVRDEAEARGFGWAYWELVSDFGVYDARAYRWREPVRRALLD